MKDEYIRKQDAINALEEKEHEPWYLHKDLEWISGVVEAKDEIKSLEPADVVPVVHGHWEYIDDTYCGFEDTDVRCSVCKTTTNIKRFRKTKWCPDCGAKMDGEE